MATAQSALRKYKLGPVKPWVQNAADLLGNMFGFAVIGGWRAVGSVPNSDHPKGLALDFMTLSPKKANSLIDYLIQHQSELAVKYIIYNRQIWQDGAWKHYSGPNPHIDHVHVSFLDSAPSGSALTSDPGIIGVSNPLDISKWPVVGQLNHLAETLQSPTFWKRVGMFGLGAVLVGGGAFFLIQDEVL